jgi:hypothetical protein
LLFAPAIACSDRSNGNIKTELERRLNNMPRRFKVHENGYILSDTDPGVIFDDAVTYSADAGARTFYFADRRVLRNYFVGTWHSFESLPSPEQEEVDRIAGAAISFVDQLQRRKPPLSEVDQQHRELLRRFLTERHQN